LERFVSELESLQERLPELKVVIFGGVPAGRVAAFSYPGYRGSSDSCTDYIIPYPE
jgi:hypothetical protein